MVYTIDTGCFYLDGGAIFGVVPKELWKTYHQPDEKNRIKQSLRALLVVEDGRNIIIDCGIGNWHDEKFNEIYKVNDIDFGFDKGLAAHDLTNEEITDVILTHLHFDHAGGIITRRGRKIEPTFPNADIWIQKKQWLHAQNPSPKDKVNFKGQHIEFLSNCKKLNLPEGEANIAEKVFIYPVNGHTVGMQTVLVNDGSVKHFFPSDLVPNASHIRIPFIMAYDNDPLITVDEKQEYLSKACSENWVVHFCHDPDIENGQIVAGQGEFKIRE